MKDMPRTQQDFLRHQSEMLSRLTARAQRSALYKGRIRCIDDVSRMDELPPTFYDDIEAAIRSHGLDRVLIDPHALYWWTSGSTGAPKRIYYSAEDLKNIAKLGRRIGVIYGAKRGDAVWNLSAGNPGSMSLGLIHLICEEMNLQETMTPIEKRQDLVKALRAISKARRIDVIAGVPAIYLAVAKIVEEPESFYLQAENEIRGRLGRLRFAGGLTRRVMLRGIDCERVKKALKETKKGFLGGEILKPYLNHFRRSYPNLVVRECYGSSELTVAAIQLSDRPGLSVMLDWFIPEIADPQDVLRAKNDRGHPFKALPWWKWWKGLRGEMIITRDGTSLPLIRYPTGDVIEVIDPMRIEHAELENLGKQQIELPAITVLGRSQEVIDFAAPQELAIFLGAKAYSRQINDAMAEVKETGKVRWWNLFVHPKYEYDGKPFTRLRFQVIPGEAITDKEAFQQEVRELLRKELVEVDQFLTKLELVYSCKIVEELLQVEILEPEAYVSVDREIERRMKEGRPLGQVKPNQVHYATKA